MADQYLTPEERARLRDLFAMAEYMGLSSGRRVLRLLEERNALARFKAHVHERLDAAGVPTHPDGPHSKEGCRVGDRLDHLIGGLAAARQEAAEQRARAERAEAKRGALADALETECDISADRTWVGQYHCGCHGVWFRSSRRPEMCPVGDFAATVLAGARALAEVDHG